MRHIGVVETADDVNNGVCLAYVLQELVSKPFTLRGALYETGDVDELDDGGKGTFGLNNLREFLESFIRYLHHSHVGFDGAEGVVGSFGFCSRQRVEQGGLANVWKSDNTEAKHGVSTRRKLAPAASQEVVSDARRNVADRNRRVTVPFAFSTILLGMQDFTRLRIWQRARGLQAAVERDVAGLDALAERLLHAARELVLSIERSTMAKSPWAFSEGLAQAVLTSHELQKQLQSAMQGNLIDKPRGIMLEIELLEIRRMTVKLHARISERSRGRRS